MNSDEIKKMQKKIGVVADGFWGPKSQAACKAYLRSLMPKNNPWPKSDQASLTKFYGKPGDESNLVMINFPYPMYYSGKLVTKTRVNKKCADSLVRVLNNIKNIIPKYPHIKDDAEDYYGVFNFRLKRGGSSYSLHAYGAAIDLDADDNTFRDSWPMKADMPLEIMEEFAKEGWIAAGVFWGYDAQHFQATK